ncbi:MAG TPA: radical SAM protein [Clostridiales bacterium]|nr:radical SAM protein [Clostridiales bacterium]
MERRKIPQLLSFELSKEEIYNNAKENKLLRLGVKVNTPLACNWACPYCYAGSSENSDRPKIKENLYYKGIDPYKDKNWLEKMQNWIRQGIEMGVNTVTINGTFEPATAPDILNIIKFCRENNIYTTLVTNGTLWSYEQLEELYNLGICILTKLNVPMVDEKNENYKLFCDIQKELSGRKQDSKTVYEEQKKLINDLIKIGFNKHVGNNCTRLGVESIIAKNNLKYLPDLVKQLRELNIYSHVEVMKLQGFARNNPNLQVTKSEIKQLFQNILDNDIASNFEPWEVKPPYAAGSCYQNLVRVDLKADGNIAPCPGIDLILGNMNENKLEDILKNEKLKIIRNLEQYIQGDCKNCELFKNKECYGGCRGTVYQTLANNGCSEYECLVGSDPSCHRVKNVLDNGLTSDIFK